ncbi:hypothetical protein HYU94_02090 [Candidatus Daviesbacteria bacterium]|nr:hypothetical protein [Candidatus Daviesbacteria bacterium]
MRERLLPYLLAAGLLLPGCAEANSQTGPQIRPKFEFEPLRGLQLDQFRLTFDPRSLEGVGNYKNRFNERGYAVEVDLNKNGRSSIFYITIENSPRGLKDQVRASTGSYGTDVAHFLIVYLSRNNKITRVTWDNRSVLPPYLPTKNPN